MKLVRRGDTTVVDAYLSPILRRYVDAVAAELPARDAAACSCSRPAASPTRTRFQGKDAILSGPAGGIVGAVETAAARRLRARSSASTWAAPRPTSSHYAGEFERAFETEVAGVRLRAPMMSIHTVAAGGGSILRFDGARFRVGPEAPAPNPGPACYRRGGPLTVTDCNVMVGKLQPAFFPRVFGPNGDAAARRRGRARSASPRSRPSSSAPPACAARPRQIADGFLAIAVDNMANAIKQISIAARLRRHRLHAASASAAPAASTPAASPMRSA